MGHTSEEVDAEIDEGRFGMAEETGRMLNEASSRGAQRRPGARRIRRPLHQSTSGPVSQPRDEYSRDRRKARHSRHRARRHRDRYHPHASRRRWRRHRSDLAVGLSTARRRGLRDGRRGLSESGLCRHSAGSVLENGVARTQSWPSALTNITTVNMDFLAHYRPLTNVVRRPTQKGGKGYSLTGHHEIMVPLLAAAVLERIGVTPFAMLHAKPLQ